MKARLSPPEPKLEEEQEQQKGIYTLLLKFRSAFASNS